MYDPYLKNSTVCPKQCFTRFGVLNYMPDNIYTFDEGLAGFREHLIYVRTALPQLPNNSSYGLLQSLKTEDVSFILFYPQLSDDQVSIIYQKIKMIVRVDKKNALFANKIDRSDITVAFLVIINDVSGQRDVRCVQDAPIVFVDSLKKAWQVLLQ